MAWPHGIKNDEPERRTENYQPLIVRHIFHMRFLFAKWSMWRQTYYMYVQKSIISLGLIFLAPTEGRLEADDNLNPPLKCPQSTTFALFWVTMWLPGTLLTFSLFVSSSFAFLSHGSITVRWILLSSVQIVKVVFTGRTLMVVTGILPTAGFRLLWL